MSKIGSLTRGLKYSLQRANGDLPEGIANDPAKMNDVNIYEEFIQTRSKKKVDSLLIHMRNLQRSGLKAKPKYAQAKAALNSDDLIDQAKVDALKPIDYSLKTKAELQTLLNEQNISYDVAATKADLLALLQGA